MWSFFHGDSPNRAADPVSSNDRHEHDGSADQPNDPHDSLVGCFLGALAGKPNGSPLCQDELEDVRKYDRKSANNCPCATPLK